MQTSDIGPYPYPETSYAHNFGGLSYRIFHPLVSNMYLKSVSKKRIESDLRNLLGDGVHSLACKFEGYLQQFLRDIRVLLLHLAPLIIVEHPRDAIPLCVSRRCPFCSREKGKLSTSRPSDDEFRVFALEKVVLRLEYAAFQQVKAIGAIAGIVEDSPSGILFAYEERHDLVPEIFGLVGDGRKGLEN